MATKDFAKRLAKTSDSVEPDSERQRHSLVLRAWEVINSERELQGVLEAVADVLVLVVPFFGVALLSRQKREGAPWRCTSWMTPRFKMKALMISWSECESIYPPKP